MSARYCTYTVYVQAVYQSVCARKCRFDGEWVDGVKQGKGTYTFGSGDVFEGTYDNNERHGEGFLSKKDGEKRQENWKLGKLVSFQVVEEAKK